MKMQKTRAPQPPNLGNLPSVRGQAAARHAMRKVAALDATAAEAEAAAMDSVTLLSVVAEAAQTAEAVALPSAVEEPALEAVHLGPRKKSGEAAEAAAAVHRGPGKKGGVVAAAARPGVLPAGRVGRGALAAAAVAAAGSGGKASATRSPTPRL
jgi:hypothetical protein